LHKTETENLKHKLAYLEAYNYKKDDNDEIINEQIV
jgi:hypothetical protein